MPSPVRPLLAATLLLAACSHKGQHEAHEAHGESHAAAEAAEGEAEEGGGHGATHAGHMKPGALTLKLDDGRKWQMDDHTRAALGTIERRLAEGPETDDLAGYKALGSALDDEIQALVRGCTMTGPAHDQLHVWLTRFIPAVGALAEAPDASAAKGKRTEITILVASARQHFE